MKAVFLYQDQNLPSSRVRVLNIISHLSDEKTIVDAFQYPRKLKEKRDLFRKLIHYDVVVLQRKLMTCVDQFVLRKLSKFLIFDFDDAIYIPDDNAKKPHSRTRAKRFQAIVKACDHIVAGNRILAEQAARWNPSVCIIPSAVPAFGVATKNHAKENPAIRICWVGTKSNLPYLEQLNPIFTRLAKKYLLELHVISNEGFSCPDLTVFNKAWSEKTQEQEIASCDIGVMPLKDSSWAAGKCGYKALQYMAAGVPPICSKVGANADCVDDGIDGYVVDRLEAFYDALERLIIDKARRASMGKKAREKIVNSYSIEVIAKKWKTLLHSGCYTK